tara:strand:+ start:31611 stop:32294 length:684 start_codon:yes stop_codon:yes gene_type:complete
MHNWQRFTDRAVLDTALAQAICKRLSEDIEAHGHASLAVSGGSTPRALFRQLSHTPLAWDKVTLCLVDERWVATDSPDSNEKLVRDQLLQDKAAAARFIGMKTADITATAGIPDVIQRMETVPLPFSMVVLGMGGDGHTASWFPQAINLDALLAPDNTALVAATEPVSAPHSRVTLTLAAVMRSRAIAIHITGDDKLAVLDSAIDNDLPVGAILSQHTSPVTIWWAP